MLVKFLISLPTWAMAVFVCTAAVTFTTLAQAILHRRWQSESRSRLNEVAGFLIAVVGVIYAVLLASIAILVLERHQRAEMAVETEAGRLSDLFVTVNGLPTAVTEKLRSLMTDYVHHGPGRGVAENGRQRADPWRMAGQGLEPYEFDRQSPYVGSANHGKPKSVVAAALKQFDDIADARRERLFTTGSGITPLVWSILISGAVVTVSLALFSARQAGAGISSWQTCWRCRLPWCLSSSSQ